MLGIVVWIGVSLWLKYAPPGGQPMPWIVRQVVGGIIGLCLVVLLGGSVIPGMGDEGGKSPSGPSQSCNVEQPDLSCVP